MYLKNFCFTKLCIFTSFDKRLITSYLLFFSFLEIASEVYADFSKLITSKSYVESADVPSAIEVKLIFLNVYMTVYR